MRARFKHRLLRVLRVERVPYPARLVLVLAYTVGHDVHATGGLAQSGKGQGKTDTGDKDVILVEGDVFRVLQPRRVFGTYI